MRRSTDITNATEVVLRYSYEPYALNLPQGSGLVNAVDTGSGSGVVPVDSNIGSIYYRILFLDVNRTVLATSDIQQF